jgi:hypothetical protein
MELVHCYAYAEDEPSCAVIKRLVEFQNANSETGTTLVLRPGFPANQRGFGQIKSRVDALVQMAEKGLTTLVVTDLDTRECAPTLLSEWFGFDVNARAIPEKLWFRVAEREVEAWLLADHHELGRFLDISAANFRLPPDALDDPKQFLLNVVRAKCHKNRFREMLPQGNARIGTAYNGLLCDFIVNHWCPIRAADRSPSLSRALDRLRQFS